MTLDYRACLAMLAAVVTTCFWGCATLRLGEYVGRDTAPRHEAPSYETPPADHQLVFSSRRADFENPPATESPPSSANRTIDWDYRAVDSLRQATMPDAAIQRVSHFAEANGSPLEAVEIGPPLGGDNLEPARLETISADPSDDNVLPIDLANALAMGGADHLQIQLAREKVLQASAELTMARAHWLPSLRFGVGWNKHDGRLQETEGTILEISRNSLFIGGGAGLGAAGQGGSLPLTGGAGGPSRLSVDLSLADAIFDPIVARRTLAAQFDARDATISDALLEIALAYFDLVEAHGRLANARQGLDTAQLLLQLTTNFQQAGAGSMAEVDRANTEAGYWRQAVQDAQRQTVARSAELVRLLQMDPHLTLVPADDKVLPVKVVDPQIDLQSLIAAGLSSRPELSQHQWLVEASAQQLRQERWRPLLPHLQAGASVGAFGGGPSATFAGQSDRSDVDLLAVWELRNMGYGNLALLRERASQLRQAEYQTNAVRDRIASEIVVARGDVVSYQAQIQAAMDRVVASGESYRRNLRRIRQGEGLPIELLQAIRAQADALNAHLEAVTQFNRAQYRLLRALGVPPRI